ncbi:hypothetical protein [Phenylobacterium sp.]|jgi:hypothetical protein|uniref:hypothetical protein n=1 Tax=Phenylobacterium sp. TaxID=1871053 RepID=UPI002F9324D7
MTPKKDPEADVRAAWLVLGMHRSGTSAVTQLLALAGCDLPANLMPGDEHNAKGYFEPWTIAMFNDDRLHAAGSAWDDVFAHPFRPLEPTAERDFLDRAKALFEDEFGGDRHPLLKDPRITVLLPFWRNLFADLALEARCVIPVRHPLAVAGSLARRDGFPPEKSVLLWCAYMLAAEVHTRDLPRAFVSYDALLADWRTEVARAEAALGAPLPALTREAGVAIDRFLSPDLRHNTTHEGLEALGWAGALAQPVLAWFEAAAAGQIREVAPLQQATAELVRRKGEFGMLVSPAARDMDVLRSEAHKLKQQLAWDRRKADELRTDMQRDIETIQAKWQSDVTALQEQSLREVAEKEARLQALEAELEALRHAYARAGAQLDRILAES